MNKIEQNRGKFVDRISSGDGPFISARHYVSLYSFDFSIIKVLTDWAYSCIKLFTPYKAK